MDDGKGEKEKGWKKGEKYVIYDLYHKKEPD